MLVVFTRGIVSFQGFLGGAKWNLSIHSKSGVVLVWSGGWVYQVRLAGLEPGRLDLEVGSLALVACEWEATPNHQNHQAKPQTRGKLNKCVSLAQSCVETLWVITDRFAVGSEVCQNLAGIRTQQKHLIFAWLVENKGDPKRSKKEQGERILVCKNSSKQFARGCRLPLGMELPP